MPVRKGDLLPIAIVQPAPLKCVPTSARLPIRRACALEQFAPYCCASASLFECVLKLQRVNCTTVVVTRIPDFAAYIIDGGQDWTATVVLFDMVI